MGVFFYSTFYFKRFLTFDFSKKRLLTGLSKDAARRSQVVYICVWLPGWFIGHGACSVHHGLDLIPLDFFSSNLNVCTGSFLSFSSIFQTNEETASQIIMKLCNYILGTSSTSTYMQYAVGRYIHRYKYPFIKVIQNIPT